MSDDESSGPHPPPGYSAAIRKRLDQKLVRRAVIAAAVYGAALAASEWQGNFWPALAVFVTWQAISGTAARLTRGMPKRLAPNAAFFVINSCAVVAFGVVTGWSTEAKLMVPLVIGLCEIVGSEDVRWFIHAKLVIFGIAMTAGGVAHVEVAAIVLLSWFIHWLGDGRSLTRRAVLAELAQTNASLSTEIAGRLKVEAELRQAQKLESVGRLASGVAHEINTPMQYVKDSLQFICGGLCDLAGMVKTYRAAAPRTPELEQAEVAADVDYLLENLPGAVDRSRDGVERISVIVRSMRDFAHPEVKELRPADLNRGIESTLVIAASEYRLVADVVKDLGELPTLVCNIGELNQVVLNLVVNAAHAIGERVGKSGERGVITLRSRREGDHVLISVGDTGGGVPDAIRERIFEPFFTTKEVGRGTGQGLAIARAVVAKHRGTLTFESRAGQGTTFFIRLPIGAEPAMREAA